MSWITRGKWQYPAVACPKCGELIRIDNDLSWLGAHFAAKHLGILFEALGLVRLEKGTVEGDKDK